MILILADTIPRVMNNYPEYSRNIIKNIVNYDILMKETVHLIFEKIFQVPFDLQ